ncbi:MAG: cation diffusion facilitator family transporter [Acetobacteraceae bacterium]|nr:cation diffusion facilitator family transporter [Acetobacteraceae bacterium]MDW8399193.1 cation diffusion facilitator family transporter [Acetobacteraceae bacterium]
MPHAARLALSSLAVAGVVLVLKGASAWITGSVALFADAAETLVHMAGSAVVLASILYGQRPPDANHPYGHAKAEYFSAALIGAMIAAAAVAILFAAWEAFAARRMISEAPTGIAVTAVATVINALWARHLIRRGRSLGSPALVADGHHLMSDVITSLGVLAGILLVALTGLWWLDPLLAALAALGILWSGARLIRESVGGLMDEALPPERIARIEQIVAAHGAGGIEAHDLRTRRAGARLFVEFHLVVPGAMTVADSHAICDRIEEAIRAEFAPATITIHVEPHGKAKREGVRLA